MKKLRNGLLGAITLIALMLCCFLAIPQKSVSANAAGAPSIEITSSKTEIKANATGNDAQFVVTATVKNETNTDMFSAQVQIVFDTAVFEYVSFTASTDIGKSIFMASESNASAGVITMYADNNYNAIDKSKKSWKVGSFVMRLKSGAAVTANSAITVNEENTLICDFDTMDSITRTIAGGGAINMKVSAPSNACQMTALKVNNVAASQNGKIFTFNAPYTYDKLTSVSPTVSAGATVSYSPALNSTLSVGENTVTITVTAENKTTTDTYTLKINRAAAESENKLSALTFKINNGDTLVTKTAAELTTAGTYAVANDIDYAKKDQLRIESTKLGSFSKAQLILDGKQLGSDVTTAAINANIGVIGEAGAHTLTVKVIAQSGATNEYKITFNIVGAQADNTLSTLTLKVVGGDAVNFNVPFSPNGFTYSASVPAGTQKVRVEATAAGNLASIAYSNPSQEYGVPSTIEVTVTAQSGDSNKYVIVVTEQKDLSGANIDGAKLFVIDEDGKSHDYTDKVTETSVSDYYTVTIPFTLNITKYRIEATEPENYRLDGANIDIRVPNSTRTNFTHYVYLRQNNIAEKTITYDFIFESNVKTLSELFCNGVKVDISTGKNFFLIEVDKDTSKAKIELTATDRNATITVESLLEQDGGVTLKGDGTGSSQVNLGSGITPIMIAVKPNPEVEGMYVLCIKRPVGTQILQSLKCGDTNVKVEDNTKIYEVKADAKVDKMRITAGGIEGASVFIDYANVDEVISEGEKIIKLDGESTLVPIKVTAADGTVGMYMLNVTRELPGVDTMPYIVAIVVICVVAVVVIIALAVVIIVNRRKG